MHWLVIQRDSGPIRKRGRKRKRQDRVEARFLALGDLEHQRDLVPRPRIDLADFLRLAALGLLQQLADAVRGAPRNRPRLASPR